MKTANLFLNGSYTDYGDIIDRSIYTIAADGGVLNALDNGCKPVIIIGDGDSIKEVPKAYKEKIQGIPYIPAPDQDFTDFEKALHYLKEKGYTYINVYCFSGDRVDHMISGLSICSSFKTMTVVLFTSSQIVMMLPKSFFLQINPRTIISLLPFPTAYEVTTSGLQWNLSNARLELGGFLSVSNKTLQSEVNIRYTKGTLFLFRPIKK